jgi:hypothetical protein
MARVGHGTGDLWKIFGTFPDFAGTFFGFSNFDRKIFRIFKFRANFFWIFQLSTGKFLGFSNFEPEKIPEMQIQLESGAVGLRREVSQLPN